MNISDLPSNANFIGCKWVHKVKFAENVYDNHRARMVALGYQERQGVDYFQSFSVLTQASRKYFLLCQDEYVKASLKCGLTQLKSDECVFVKSVNNIKGAPPLHLDNILDYGVKTNCDELIKEFLRQTSMNTVEYFES